MLRIHTQSLILALILAIIFFISPMILGMDSVHAYSRFTGTNESVFRLADPFSGKVRPARDEVERKLDEVISHKKYNYLRDETGSENVIERMIRKIGEFLDRNILDRFGRELNLKLGALGLLGPLIKLLLVLFLLFGAAWIVSRISFNSVGDSVMPAECRKSLFSINVDDDPLKAAEECAGRADYRQAVRILYIGILLALGRKKAVELADFKTNWEYFDEASDSLLFRSNDGLIDSLRTLTHRFDETWFGKAVTTEAHYTDALKFYAMIAGDGGERN